jgi:hypothetical protein
MYDAGDVLGHPAMQRELAVLGEIPRRGPGGLIASFDSNLFPHLFVQTRLRQLDYVISCPNGLLRRFQG